MRDIGRLFLVVALGALAAGPLAPARADEPQRLSLADAVAVASSKAPAVTLAQLREREARARVGQARAAFLPGVSGAAYENSRTFNVLTTGFDIPSIPGQPPTPTIIGPVKSYDARLKVTETLFDGASWARLHAANDGVRASAADTRGTAEGAAQNAAVAYLQVTRAAAQLDARIADEKIADELAGLAAQQQQAGVSPEIDVVRARTQLAAARGQRLVAQNQLDRAQIALARALGVDPSTRFALTDSLSAATARSTAPDSGAAAVAQALGARPELEAERARLDRAKADKRATALERLPRLDVSGDWGPSGITVDGATPTRQWTVAVSMPLLDGLRREGRLAEQGEVVRESEVRIRDLRDQVASEVQGAQLDIANGAEQQAVAEERLSLAERELSEARERFAQGVANNVEVINAQSSLVRARDAVIDARYATAVARIALARATGAAQTLR